MDRSPPILFRRPGISARPTVRRAGYCLSMESVERDPVNSLRSNRHLQQNSQVSRNTSSGESSSQSLRHQPCCDRDPVPQSDRERWESTRLCVGSKKEEDLVISREQGSTQSNNRVSGGGDAHR